MTCLYLESAEHWLIAAALRREMMVVQGLNDVGHIQAVEFAIKNYRYNMALHRGTRSKMRRLPAFEAFGLYNATMKTKDEIAAKEIAAVTGINVS
jgi:hypothetical protein